MTTRRRQVLNAPSMVGRMDPIPLQQFVIMSTETVFGAEEKIDTVPN